MMRFDMDVLLAEYRHNGIIEGNGASECEKAHTLRKKLKAGNAEPGKTTASTP
jgi:hypothetical protein